MCAQGGLGHPLHLTVLYFPAATDSSAVRQSCKIISLDLVVESASQPAQVHQHLPGQELHRKKMGAGDISTGEIMMLQQGKKERNRERERESNKEREGESRKEQEGKNDREKAAYKKKRKKWKVRRHAVRNDFKPGGSTLGKRIGTQCPSFEKQRRTPHCDTRASRSVQGGRPTVD